MDMMEGFIGEDGDDENLKITYLSNKTGSVPAEGDDAIQALQDDFEDDEEDEESEETEDEELLEMVSTAHYPPYQSQYLNFEQSICRISLILNLINFTQFEELSKGKDYITEKALRKWDELQELIEADLATQEVIDSYISRIEITNGRVSLEAFRHFMKMLDMVIIDESGNFMTMDEADEADRKA